MKIILAPDSFKGTMTSKEVIDIMKAKLLILEAVEIIEMPLADGGEGTLETLLDIMGGHKVYCEVHDPLMRKLHCPFGMFHETAIIEMALASGLTLLDERERNPLMATSYGTGELILEALNQGASKIIIAIGGSATNDGGIGMAKALGVKFFDEAHVELSAHACNLHKIHTIDVSAIDPRLKKIEVEVMCDVNNVFTGNQGATYTYGHQKGGSDAVLATLENGMINLSKVIKKQFKIDLNNMAGSGAAGGLGGGLLTFLSGNIKSGIETVLDLSNFRQHLKLTDYVITGEGKLDRQSLFGKAINGIRHLIDGTQSKLIIVAGYSEMDKLDGAFIVSTTDKKYDDAYIKKHAQENLKTAMNEVVAYIRSNNG